MDCRPYMSYTSSAYPPSSSLDLLGGARPPEPALLLSDPALEGCGGISLPAPLGAGCLGPPRSDCALCGAARCDDPANPATLRSKGFGFGPARTESARDMAAVFELREDPGLDGGLSLSGGGVGGNTLRFIGGSDCCLLLLLRSGLTRLLAAYDILSVGLSSFAASTLFIRFNSEPVKPVNVWLRSVAATKRALPR